METERSEVELVGGETVKSIARAALLAALMGAAAYVSIPLPFSPVPVTLQVLVVFLAGLYLGPYWGTVSMVLYLVAGGLGAPVFANGAAGVGVLVGDTAGYLWAYPLATILIGTIVHDGLRLRDPADAPLPVLAGALVAATVVIYALGCAWLAWVFELNAAEALSAGALPFVPGELVKMAAAIAIVRSRRIAPT